MSNSMLIYSNYCVYSNKFIEILQKHKELANSFNFLNIDVDPQTGRRPQLFYDIQKQLNFNIKEVPTILLNDGEYILAGEEAFKWLDYEVKKTSKKNLEGFNPNEMGSFSDMYSPLGNTDLHNASEQSFKFIHKPNDNIQTPPEDANEINFTNSGFVTGTENMSKEKLIESRLEELIAERQRSC
jgi:hypothetical protein